MTQSHQNLRGMGAVSLGWSVYTGGNTHREPTMHEPQDIREYLSDEGEFTVPVDARLGVYSARRRGFLRRPMALGCTVLSFFACALLLLPALS